MSAQASSDLIWRVVKSNNAFLVKQRAGRGAERTSLSKEQNNVAATSSFKYSGLAHAGAGLALTTEGQIKVVRGSKKAVSVSAKKPGQAKRVATKGRKDLRTVCLVRCPSLQPLTHTHRPPRRSPSASSA